MAGSTGIIADLTSISSVLKTIQGTLEGITSAAGTAANAVNGVSAGGSGGGAKTGNGGNKVGLADVPAPTGGGGMSGGLGLAGFSGGISNLVKNRPNFLSGALAGGAMLANLGGAAVSGAAALMPDVSATMNRQGDYYGATLSQAYGTSISDIQANAKSNGLFKTGMSGQIANYMGNAGMMMGSAQYNATQQGVTAASTLMNMDPMAATKALVGLQSGATSSNLYKNYNVFTSDPTTGKPNSMLNVFRQLESRLSLGQSYNLENVNSSILSGGLGFFAQNSGLSSDQTNMFFQYMRSKAQGKEYDPTDPKSMAAALGSGGNANPLDYLYGMNSAQEQMQQNAAGTYGAGLTQFSKDMQALVPVVEKLTDKYGAMVGYMAGVNGAFPKLDSSINAAIDALGAFAGSLIANSLGSILNGGGGGGGGGRGGRTGRAPKIKRGYVASDSSSSGYRTTGGQFATAEQALGKRAANQAAMSVSGGAKTLASVGRFAEVGGVATAAVLGGVALASDAMSGQGWGTKQFSSDVGSTVGGIAGGIAGAALGTAILPGIGTAVGGFLGSMGGSWLGGQIGNLFGTGGVSNAIATGASTPTGKSAITFMMPVNGKISDGFGPRVPPAPGASAFHDGIDIAAGEGTAIGASAGGKVTVAKWNGSYGNYVEIDHGNGFHTFYGHLSQIGVTVGATVVQGQRIGAVGNTGLSTGAHLHFGMHLNGAKVNPLIYVKGGVVNISGGRGANNAPAGSASAGTGMQDLTGASSLAQKLPDFAKVGSYKGASIGRSGMASGSQSGASSKQGYMGASMGTANVGSGRQASMSVAGLASAKQGDSYVAQDSAINVHAGEAILTAQQADTWRQALKTGKLGGGGGNNITINVTVAQASEAEAIRLAQMIKRQLENDSMISTMGSK